TAENFLLKAESINSEHPLIYSARSNLLEAEDRYEEALEPARKLCEENPSYLPGIKLYIHKLLLLDRSEEAHTILLKAVDSMESFHLITLLILIEIEFKMYDKALSRMNLFTPFLPYFEKKVKQTVAAIKVSLHHLCGDDETAKQYAREMDDEYHQYLINKMNSSVIKKRSKLDVHFVRQHYKTCAPATISALSNYWGKSVGQLAIIESICYDGTPSYKIRTWAENNGWYIREFTVTWESIVLLIDLNIPVGISIVSPENGHFQLIIGYDPVIKTILIRDPFVYFTQEVRADKYLDYFRSTGPRGTLLLPPEKSYLIKDIILPDVFEYDLLNEVHCFLDIHQREKALEAVEKLKKISDSHFITLEGCIALAGYDGNIPTLLGVLNKYIEQFPDDPVLLHMKCHNLSEIGHHAEKMEILSNLCKKPDKHPIFWAAYGKELMKDSRKKDDAFYWLKQALKYLKNNAPTILLLGQLLWTERRYEDAAELYWYAACIEDKDESYLQYFFQASQYLQQTDKAVEYLTQRVERFGKQSVYPVISLINAYRILDKTGALFQILEAQLVQHPENGDLLTFAAHIYASYGKYKKAEEFLQRAKGRAREKVWLTMAAKLAGYKSEKKQAIKLWQEIINLEPLSIEAHTLLALLLAETEGKESTFRYLEKLCEDFPYQFDIHKLRIVWLRDEQPGAVETICTQLLAKYDCDAWIYSELASALFKQRNSERAEKEIKKALSLDSFNPDYHTLLGDIYGYQNKQQEAKEAYKKAISLRVDTTTAILGLVSICMDKDEKKEALNFVEQELIAQTVFGDGLIAFYNTAQGIIDQDELLSSLRFAHQERDDLWITWSVLISHLISMNKLDEAEAIALAGINQFPLNPYLRLDLARIMQFKPDLEGEIQAISKAREINPSLSEASQRLSQLYMRKGEFKKALEIMELAIASTPLVSSNYEYLAQILYRLGDRKEALYKLRRAILINPAGAGAWELLWQWAHELKEPWFCIDVAEKLLEQRKDDPHILLLLAESFFYAGEDKKGLEAIDRALVLDPRCIEAYDLKARYFAVCERYDEALHYCSIPEEENVPASLSIRRAWIEGRRGSLHEAVRILQQVLSGSPESEYGWYLFLEYLHLLKSTEQLEKAAIEMMKLFPLNSRSYVYLGTLYKEKGFKEKAKDLFRKAFLLSPSDSYAGTQLCGLQLETNNMEKAENILALLKSQLGDNNEYYLAAKARVLIKKKDVKQSIRIFNTLAARSINDSSPLQSVADAFDEQGLNDIVYSLAKKNVALNGYRAVFNRHIGPIWIKHNAEKNKWLYFSQLRTIFRESGVPALSTYIIELGKAVKNILGSSRFFTLTKYKFILMHLYKNYRGWIKNTPDACGVLGETLLLCGLIDPAIKTLQLWDNHHHYSVCIINNYITALYLKRNFSKAEFVTKQVKEWYKDDPLFTSTQPGFLFLWEVLHTLLIKSGTIQMEDLHRSDNENELYEEKTLYNIVHFLLKKQEYPCNEKKHQHLSRYVQEFPHAKYMINIYKYLLKKKE
ncbi:MAG: tetratricopeptide repeat protein, partial [Spirochaetales bacterium]|nr:tetratricopeptide repeat protein [Spirochaetales bacterium]